MVPRTVRVHYPNTDGYSILLHPGQSFKISVFKESEISDDARIVLDSQFLSLDDKFDYYNSKSEKKELVFEINQIYDLTSWANNSSIFLGNVLVVHNNRTICACVYLAGNTQDIVTVINPKSHKVKLKPNQTLHLVCSNECIENAQYNYLFNDNICKLQFEVGLVDQSYSLNDLPLLNENLTIKHNKAKEFHFYFKVILNSDESKLSYDTYDGGILKLTATGVSGDSGIPVVEETSFLGLLISIKEKKTQNEHFDLLTKRIWDGTGNVLINPLFHDRVSLNEPELNFLIEIAEPFAFYPNLKNKNIAWNISCVKSKSCLSKGFIINPLNDCIEKLSDGSSIVVNRFRVTADCIGRTAFEADHGSIYLSCSDDGIVYERKIEVFISPPKSVNYNNIKSKHKTYQHQPYYYQPTTTLSEVTINKLSGSIFDGITSLKLKNKNITVIPVKKNLIRIGTENIEMKENSELLISPSVDKIYVRRGSRIFINIETDYSPLQSVESFENIWSCIVMQNKTYLICRDIKIKIVESKLVQTFEVVLCPHYLPQTNRINHYLCGLKFVRNKSGITMGAQKYVSVFLTHNSIHDKNIIYDRLYLANDFYEKSATALLDKKVDIKVKKAEKLVSISNWRHNSGIIFAPESAYDISLCDKNSDWQVKIRQYPIPDLVWDVFEGSLESREFPWWPDDLHPDEFNGTNYRISSILDYQPLFYRILEEYHMQFKCTTFPIGEVIFRSNVLVQNREISGTLVRTRQRYVKKLYLFGEYFNEEYEVYNDNVPSFVELQSPLIDGQSVYVPENKELRLVTSTQSTTLAMLPVWMRLKSTYFNSYGRKTFVFYVESNEIDLFNDDENAYTEGYIVLLDNSKITRIKAVLERC